MRILINFDSFITECDEIDKLDFPNDVHNIIVYVYNIFLKKLYMRG